MIYKFTKMQSLGNDFVMFNGISENIRITDKFARHIANRHFGIGCDQILLVERAKSDPGYGVRIFNSDGSEVGQCGNGARCLARYMKDQGLVEGDRFEIDTITLRLQLQLNPEGSVTVGMGEPMFAPDQIPLAVAEEVLTYPIRIGSKALEFSAVSIGNPHCVFEVSDVATAPVHELGPLVEVHSLFPERVNVGFSQTNSRQDLKLRVFERGAGETLGCGSGACAAVVSGIRKGALDRRVTVTLPGGSISVEWAGPGSQVFLEGPVDTVFEGSIEAG